MAFLTEPQRGIRVPLSAGRLRSRRLGNPGWGQSDHTACCFCRESGNSSWEIPRASKAEEGVYQCIAVSRAGTGRASAQIVITGGSPSLCVPTVFFPSPRSVLEVTLHPQGRVLVCCHLGTVSLSEHSYPAQYWSRA